MRIYKLYKKRKDKKGGKRRRNKETFNGNEVFTYHKNSIKKLPLRNCLKLKDKHLIFGKHTTNICKVLEENLMQC